jgi:phosphatidylglycerophosphate synthase
LARTRGKITNFGILFDPLADKLLIGSMVLLVVFQNFSFYLGITVLALEIIFILSAFVAKYKFKTVKAANVWGKIKMILQVFAVFLTLAGLLLHFQYFFTLAAWLFGLAIGFAIVSLFAHGV